MEETAKQTPTERAQQMKQISNEFEGSFEASSASEVAEYKGYRITPPFSAEAVDYALNEWSVREGDVMVASYPKTGTNWMLSTIRRLLYQDPEEYDLVKNVPLNLSVIETGPVNKFQAMDKMPLKRRVLGTHLPAELINLENFRKNNAKVVYILRNPKDQIVSFFHFFKKMAEVVDIFRSSPMLKLMENWDEYVSATLQGAFPLASKPGEWYPEHILSWHKEKGDHVYFIYYEDLKKDYVGELRRLAAFLDIDLSEEKAKEIAELCTISAMRNDAKQVVGEVAKFQAANIRKGEVGGWKEYFTVAQSEAVDAEMKKKLGNVDVKFTYC